MTLRVNLPPVGRDGHGNGGLVGTSGCSKHTHSTSAGSTSFCPRTTVVAGTACAGPVGAAVSAVVSRAGRALSVTTAALLAGLGGGEAGGGGCCGRPRRARPPGCAPCPLTAPALLAFAVALGWLADAMEGLGNTACSAYASKASCGTSAPSTWRVHTAVQPRIPPRPALSHAADVVVCWHSVILNLSF